VIVAGSRDWGQKQTITVTYRPDGSPPVAYSKAQDAAWLWRNTIQPWLKLRARGVGVMVGEWGSHSATPHAVTLAWMRDQLNNYENAGLGWALWNLEGSFGPVNSGRAGVNYETYEGRRLDRAMFDLLREFTGRREAYRRWQERVFPPGSVPEALRSPDADAVGDGLPNFARYAFALPPTEPAFTGAPGLAILEPGLGQRTAEFRYRQSRRETGAVFHVLASDDLRRWQEVGASPETVEVSQEYELKAVRLPADVPARFVRLDVAQPPW
jgi:hypothetical protein